jgi:hypothetical protein
MTRSSSIGSSRRQRGATLVESLVAFVFVVAAGVGATQAMHALRGHADGARQRTEAVRLAVQAIESLRAFDGAASGPASFAAIVDADRSVAGVNASFRIEQRVVDGRGEKAVSVGVAWADRHGETRRIRLDGALAGHAPMLSAALALGGAPAWRIAPYGRDATIPPGAVALGDGRSVWKPAPGDAAGLAIVFADASGEAVAVCSGVGSAPSRVGAGDLAACTSGRWLVVSGAIRFAGPLLSTSVALTLAPGRYPAAPMCSSEAMKTVRVSEAGGLRLAAVALDAAPPSLDAVAWVETGDRFVGWHCLVAPDADGRWSGRADLQPFGWTIGGGAADRRVCRYVDDRDGSGAIDANVEHPAEWVGVDAALGAQNFLVVRGDLACADAGGTGAPDAHLATASHQP